MPGNERSPMSEGPGQCRWSGSRRPGGAGHRPPVLRTRGADALVSKKAPAQTGARLSKRTQTRASGRSQRPAPAKGSQRSKREEIAADPRAPASRPSESRHQLIASASAWALRGARRSAASRRFLQDRLTGGLDRPRGPAPPPRAALRSVHRAVRGRPGAGHQRQRRDVRADQPRARPVLTPRAAGSRRTSCSLRRPARGSAARPSAARPSQKR